VGLDVESPFDSTSFPLIKELAYDGNIQATYKDVNVNLLTYVDPSDFFSEYSQSYMELKRLVSNLRSNMYRYKFRDFYDVSYSQILKNMHTFTGLNRAFLFNKFSNNFDFFYKLCGFPLKNFSSGDHKVFAFNNFIKKNVHSVYFGYNSYLAQFNFYFELDFHFFRASEQVLNFSISRLLKMNNDFGLMSFFILSRTNKDMLSCFPTLYKNKQEGFYIHYSTYCLKKFPFVSRPSALDYYSYAIFELSHRFKF